jgi:predicted transposase YdaD
VRRLLANFSLVLEEQELQCYLKFSARLRRNVIVYVIVYRKLSKQLQLVVEQTRQSLNVDPFNSYAGCRGAIMLFLPLLATFGSRNKYIDPLS